MVDRSTQLGHNTVHARDGDAMQTNTAKHRLHQGQAIWGTSLAECLDPEIPVLLHAAGLDFFFADTEHATTTHAQIQTLCRSARAAGIIPMVRVTQSEPHLITRILDVGAMGVIVPRVQDAVQARRVVENVKFPPEGRRGFGLRSIVTDMRESSAAEQIAASNRETAVILQIESAAGVEAAAEIAAVPGVDALFVGPYDLTMSMGIIEQFDHPKFWEAVDRVIQAADKAGIAAGLQTPSPKILREAQNRGARLLIYASDSTVLFEGYRNALQELKGVPPKGRSFTSY